MASPLGRLNSRYSPTYFPSFVRIWMRWLWRSATISRPWESNLLMCGVRTSAGPVLVFSGKLLELVGGRHPRVGHPHVSVAIDMDAMGPHEHSAAKAPDLLA